MLILVINYTFYCIVGPFVNGISSWSNYQFITLCTQLLHFRTKKLANPKTRISIMSKSLKKVSSSENLTPSPALKDTLWTKISLKRVWEGTSTSSIYHLYFHLVYYSLCGPFRLKQCSNGEIGQHAVRFKLEKNWTRFVSGVLSLLTFPWYIRSIRLVIGRPNYGGQSRHFRTCYHVVVIIKRLVILKALWFDKKNLVKIDNYLAQIQGEVDKHFSEKLKTYWRKVVFWFCVPCILAYAVTIWLGIKEAIFLSNHCFFMSPSSFSSWSLGRWWATIVEAGRFCFFLTPTIISGCSSEWNGTLVHEYSFVDFVVGGIAATSYIYM